MEVKDVGRCHITHRTAHTRVNSWPQRSQVLCLQVYFLSTPVTQPITTGLHAIAWRTLFLLAVDLEPDEYCPCALPLSYTSTSRTYVFRVPRRECVREFALYFNSFALFSRFICITVHVTPNRVSPPFVFKTSYLAFHS